jgi:hypothetical protein
LKYRSPEMDAEAIERRIDWTADIERAVRDSTSTWEDAEKYDDGAGKVRAALSVLGDQPADLEGG